MLKTIYTKRPTWLGALCLGVFAAIASIGHAAEKLLPFQGHLTDAAGNVISDGAKVVQFKIYDAPVSGTAVWAGEAHKLSVNGGLVNTILGTKVSLNEVDFSVPTYLEITIDADGSGTINPADPPLLPRQVILPSNFAHVSAVARTADTVENIDLITDEGNLDPAIVSGFLPTGSVLPFVGMREHIPDGWVYCDGGIYDSGAENGRFAKLFEVIGTNYGDGTSGSDTDFNVPNFRGVFLMGATDFNVREQPGGNRHHRHLSEGDIVRPHEGIGVTAGNNPARPTGFDHVHRSEPAIHLPPYHAVAFIIKL